MPEKIDACPVCRKNDFSPFMEVPDYFLTKELFTIQKCDFCGFRFVNPRPSKPEIDSYYQSDKYISHDSKGSDLMTRIYKLARIFSIRNKYGIIRKFSQHGKILDIGCGTGEFLGYCHTKGFEVTGVEPGEKARNYAQTENRITVFGTLGSVTERPDRFNCITMWHVLEHVHDPDETLGQIRQLLTPGGVLIVAVPNSNSWDAGHYKKFWAAWDVPRHLLHFTEATMHQLMLRNGFKTRKVLPQKLDAMYVSMLSEKYLAGKNKFLKSVILGLWSNFKAKDPGKGHSSLIFVLTRENT
jgi:2-polyprenyl-3-methyl-5-hydroxy-6-metoxy-1,4-benzoquinol methylase